MRVSSARRGGLAWAILRAIPCRRNSSFKACRASTAVTSMSVMAWASSRNQRGVVGLSAITLPHTFDEVACIRKEQRRIKAVSDQARDSLCARGNPEIVEPAARNFAQHSVGRMRDAANQAD